MQMSALLLLAQVGCTPPSDKAIVGFWESPPPANGIGAAYELKPDGSFLSTMTVILNETYRVTDLFRLPMSSERGCYRAEGGTLSLDRPQRRSVERYSVTTDTLTFHGSDGRSHGLHRAEPWYPRELIDYQPPAPHVGRR